MTISYADFLQTATDNDGEVLPTVGGNARFLLEASDQGVSFTPLSKGGGDARKLSDKDVQRCLDIFNKTQSITTTDYTSETGRSSYVLAIIKLWLGQRADAPLINDGTDKGGEVGAAEGDERIRLHRYRERSREVVKMAKDLFRQTHGRFFCQVCDFDFNETYFDPDFIEAHHRIPLRDLQPGTKTKPSDLAMVCANCHRMLHRGNPWPTIPELQQKMATAKAKLPTSA